MNFTNFEDFRRIVKRNFSENVWMNFRKNFVENSLKNFFGKFFENF